MSKNKIAQLRNSKGLSQSDLAKLLRVHKQTISNMENHRREPSLQNLYDLSDIFNVSIDYILCNGGDFSSELLFNKYGDFSECMTGDHLCMGLPEGVTVVRALRRMDDEQKQKFLAICKAAFPEEFNDLLYDYKDLAKGR